MSASRFAHDLDALKTIASDALAYALEKGASACETESSDGYGQTVTVRKARSRPSNTTATRASR